MSNGTKLMQFEFKFTVPPHQRSVCRCTAIKFQVLKFKFKFPRGCQVMNTCMILMDIVCSELAWSKFGRSKFVRKCGLQS